MWGSLVWGLLRLTPTKFAATAWGDEALVVCTLHEGKVQYTTDAGTTGSCSNGRTVADTYPTPRAPCETDTEHWGTYTNNAETDWEVSGQAAKCVWDGRWQCDGSILRIFI